MKKPIIVRYPPSPTGEIHIGNIRTLLFNYFFAAKHDGAAVLRFEDTDRERSDAEYEQYVIDALDTLGIKYHSGPFRQSERNEFYIDAINTLITNGDAYEGEESKDGSGDKVIRFKNPNKVVTFTDHVRGQVSIDTTDFGDFVIARSKTNPLYHLTVVVDDIDMGITHVIRGEDHITSTPRQILLTEALGGSTPEYAHVPLIIGTDKKKLSKRHGAVTVRAFVEKGYLPAAIVNYLAFLGWNPGDEREIFSMEELISEFSLQRINNSPAVFDYTKLDDVNHHYMRELPLEEYKQRALEFAGSDAVELLKGEKAELFVELILRERIKKFSEIKTMESEGDFAYLLGKPVMEEEDLTLFKNQSREEQKVILEKLVNSLKELEGNNWQADKIKEHIWPLAEELGKGEMLHPMRTSLSGKKRSPDPFTLAQILGKDETIDRLNTEIL